MLYTKPKFTVPTAPVVITACEACVYGSGPHAEHCEKYEGRIPPFVKPPDVPLVVHLLSN